MHRPEEKLPFWISCDFQQLRSEIHRSFEVAIYSCKLSNKNSFSSGTCFAKKVFFRKDMYPFLTLLCQNPQRICHPCLDTRFSKTKILPKFSVNQAGRSLYGSGTVQAGLTYIGPKRVCGHWETDLYEALLSLLSP